MSIKDDMKKKGLELMSDPRVMKLMQNEQVMKALMAVVQVPGKVNTFTVEQTERFANNMRLATDERVASLERKVDALNADLKRLQETLAKKG